MVALLFTGSAILLLSCKSKTGPTVDQTGSLMTQQSENLDIISSRNGNISYRFKTPLMEGYDNASEPYQEFRKGIYIERYNDSTHMVEATLKANYAIYLEKRMLWEAKGNVIATNASGQKLETEQLFWDQGTKKIYSKVDSKVTEDDNVTIGQGFESDEAFEEYVIYRPKGKVAVDMGSRDSTRNAADTIPLTSSMKPADDIPAGNTAPVIKEGEAVAKPSLK